MPASEPARLHEDAAPRSWATALGPLLLVLGGLVTGSVLSCQSRVSAALAAELGDPVQAALLTVVTGTAILIVIILVSPRARAGFGELAGALRTGTLSWPWLLGGAAGIYFVVTQGVAAGALGLALFAVGVVAGQMAGGLFLDRLGVAGGGRIAPSRLRVLAVLLALVAAVWGAAGSGDGRFTPLPFIMAFSAGLIGSWSMSANGRILLVSRSVVTAGFVNHIVGMAAVGAVVTGGLLVTGQPFSPPADPVLYLGGIFGMLTLFGATMLVRHLGVLLLGLTMVGGQLLGGLLLDLVLPTEGADLGIATIGGIALTLVAVGILYLDGLRRQAAGG